MKKFLPIVQLVLLVGLLVPAAALGADGAISGTVSDMADDSALAGVETCAYSIDSFGPGSCAETGSDGTYEIEGLPAGSYKVRFLTSGYAIQWYDGEQEWDEADPVTVVGAGTTAGVDAALEAYGGVSGTVSDAADDEPLAEVRVCAEEVDGNAFFNECTETAADGTYSIAELHPGRYAVNFKAAPRNYVPLTVQDVDVDSGAITPGVDAAMEEGAELEGTVTRSADGEPLEDIYVCAEREDGSGSLPCAETDAAGKYLIAGLPETNYRVSFISLGPDPIYARQYYDGKGSAAEATMVPLTVGEKTTGIDAALVEAGKLAGTVTNEAGGAPLAGIEVCASKIKPTYGTTRCKKTDSEGHYAIGGLEDGAEYSVHFVGGLDFLFQYYDGKAKFSEANLVPVENEVVSEGVDAELQPAGRVEGHVTAADTGEPFEQGQVCAVKTSASSFPFNPPCATVDSAGNYVIGGLEAGSYDVRFSAGYGNFFPGQQNYLTQFYDGAPSRSKAAPVQVTAGSATTGIDAAMQPGGKIAGSVTAEDTGLPLHAWVCALSTVHRGGEERCAYTDSAGAYAIQALRAGTYKVHFQPVSPAHDYVGEFLDNKPTKAEADPVAVSEGQALAGIDAALARGGQISGTVTDSQTHEPIGGVEVCVTTQLRCAGTDDDGEYTIRGLPAGSYKVFFRDWPNPDRHVAVYYHDKATAAEAQAVAVSAGVTTTGIDQEMELGGRISGTVFQEDLEVEIGGFSVCAFGGQGPERRCTTTDNEGQYTIAGLSAGDYSVRFSPPDRWPPEDNARWMPQYYDEADSAADAEPVHVSLGATTSGIDAHLREGGRVEGLVTVAATGEPLPGVGVCIQPVDPEAEENEDCSFTDADGEYALQGLAAGDYTVLFLPGYQGFGDPPNLMWRYYDEADRLADATPISVAAGTAYPGIDAELFAGGQISGRITEAGSGEPLEGVSACAYEVGEEEEFRDCSSSNAHGEYTISRLPTGTYKLKFSALIYEWEEGIGGEEEGGEPEPKEEFATQFYKGASSFATATPVPLTAGQMVSGIDAQMAPPVPPAPVSPPSPSSGQQGSSAGPGASPPPASPPAKPKARCRKGFMKKAVHGKRRCVKRHRHHHRKKHHRHHHR